LAKIVFQPSGVEAEAKIGENLLKVAIRADVGLKYSCGGAPSCAMCKVVVKSGEELLSAQETKELDLLGNSYFITKKRLACQSKVLAEGEIVLDISEHIQADSSSAQASSFRKPASEWRKVDSERTADPMRRDSRREQNQSRPPRSSKPRQQGSGREASKGPASKGPASK
jgi:ferredoxin